MDINKSVNNGAAISLHEIKYLKDGVLIAGREASEVMIEDGTDEEIEEQLTALADLVNPGSIAFTAGMTKKYQLAADGEWVDCLSTDTSDTTDTTEDTNTVEEG